MAIALFLQAIQALTGSQFVKDKLQRSEHVIRVLKAVGLDPEHPPADFEAVYAYALVEYGYGKPDVCLEIFRSSEIRSGLRRSFDENDPQGWLTIGEAFLASSEIGERVRSAGCNPKRELAEFAAAFLKVTRRSQTPKETLVQHQLRKIERTIDRKLEQVAGQLESLGNTAALSPGETLALASAGCRAGELAGQMRSWFEVLGYRVEPSQTWNRDYFEWVINIPVRRGRYDRVLVRGIVGEAGVRDVMALREAVAGQRTDEGWLVTARRISQAARSEVEKAENEDLMVLTFDELLDQDADFGGYLAGLEREIVDRRLEARYVPLACTKEEVDPVTHRRLGMSRYGEADGWTEGYVDVWLDDPAKEHLSILGEFGTGKTWLTLHYALSALRSYQDAKNKGVARPRLPIVIPLRDYAKAVSVESLFSEFFFRKHEIPIPGYSAFEQLNRMGKLLLIFDGFDEMAARVDKQQMINNFWELAKVVVPGSKVILTCRTEHFPEAKEGRSLLNAELQASTRGLSGETPQFEVLELEKFEDSQIRSVLLLASSAETVEQVMGNPQLLDLARRPVMTELILEALPEIEAGKPVDMSRVYLYAVKRKMERDIKAERTFTSMADKLYFLCELSWEMLSNDRMSINYREFPDRIRKLFGSAVQEEKDLDHWHYDMMGQTMLIRNSDGDYTPAHRSLLEFFVAFKFAAELGALAPDFLELAQMKSGIDRSLEPRDYTWSEYFGGGAVAPLKGFVTEKLEVLRSGFGKQILGKIVTDLMNFIVCVRGQEFPEFLQDRINEIRNSHTIRNISFENHLIGNLITFAVKYNQSSLEGLDLSNTHIISADFSNASLKEVNLCNSYLKNANFAKNIGRISAISFSILDQAIITGSDDGIIQFWDYETLEEVSSLCAHSNWITDLVVYDPLEIMATCSDDSLVKVWNLRNLSCIWEFSTHTDSVRALSISQDGKLLASCSRDTKIYVWSLETGNLKFCLNGHIGWVEDVIFHRSTSHLISCGHDHTIRIWSVDTGECVSILHGHQSWVESLSLNSEGTILASGSNDKTIRIWDLSSGECISVISAHDGRILSLTFLDDLSVASSSTDKSIKIFDWRSGETKCVMREHENWVHAIDYSKTRNILISGGTDKSFRLWDTNTGICESRVIGRKNPIMSSCIDFENDLIFMGGGDHDITIWNIYNNRSYLKRMIGHSAPILSVKISPDKTLLATGSSDTSIKIWKIESGQCIKTLWGHESVVRSLEFHPDGIHLISSGTDQSIRVWSLQTNECLRAILGHQGVVRSIVLSLDGKTLITCGEDFTIRIWDFWTGECRKILRDKGDHGWHGWVRAIQTTHDDKYLVGAFSDGTIIVWDMLTERVFHSIRSSSSAIRAIALNSDASLVATGGSDNTIRIWSLNDGSLVNVFSGHTYWVTSLHFKPDSNLLISTGQDGTARIWDWQKAECLSILTTPLPYEGMNITGVKGLSAGTIASLKALGAIEDEEVRGENVE